MRRFVFTLLLICLATPAWAEQPLIFRDEIRGVREFELLEFFKRNQRYDPRNPYKIAAVDLNNDGVEEWLFQEITSPACLSNADCRFAVGGLSEGKVALLGEMRGGKIGVADEKLYGARKLLVYNKKNDDFAYQTYVWTPTEWAFRPE